MVGQHIRALKDGRWVHGIDCGDETVLHLSEDQSPRRVRRAYRPEFVSGAEAVELVTHRERTFPPKEVVRRAYSRAADPALAAMFGDSEAFAQWCTTGLVGPRNVALAAPAPSPVAPDAPAAPASRPAKRSAPHREKRRTAPPKGVRPKKSAAKRKPAAKANRVGSKRPAKKASRAARAKTARRPAKTAPRKRGRVSRRGR